MNEKEFLSSLVKDYVTTDNSSQTKVMRDLIVRTFKPFINRGRALELGCEIGYMSELISKLVDNLDIVEGTEEFINISKKRNILNAKYFNCLFEEFNSEPIYDYIFASHVLEHLVDVKLVLNKIKTWLKPGGFFFVTVPNAKALSRQLAQEMNIINNLYELTSNDIKGGHRRVYDEELIVNELKDVNFNIVKSGGIYFKPFADFQLDEIINNGIIGKNQIEGLYRLGFKYPNMCADVYVIAEI